MLLFNSLFTVSTETCTSDLTRTDTHTSSYTNRVIITLKPVIQHFFLYQSLCASVNIVCVNHMTTGAHLFRGSPPSSSSIHREAEGTGTPPRHVYRVHSSRITLSNSAVVSRKQGVFHFLVLLARCLAVDDAITTARPFPSRSGN